MKETILRTIGVDELPSCRRDPLSEAALAIAREVVDDVRIRGEEAVREYAEKLGDIEEGAPLVLDREELAGAPDRLSSSVADLLRRTAGRIRRFAEAQRESIHDVDVPVPGGRAGQDVTPVERAGCYAPGGRFPLPSSVLMTAVTARAAGVPEVWLASPKPTPITLAAAAVADVDGLLAVGGAQAIAALAFGAGPVPACDAVVGPGNDYVTAAKKLVAGHVAIDLLAGPSELVVLADNTADASIVAADLLAQAEHEPRALPILVTLDPLLIERVNAELSSQIDDLPTAWTAREALSQGFAVCAPDIETGVGICDRLAPEHLELHVGHAREVATRCKHYGALFIGKGAGEVMGDYGAGPNHTLPTGGTARFTGGLSVLSFLRVRTWLRIDDAAASDSLARDAEKLAELEGLKAHALSARHRVRSEQS